MKRSFILSAALALLAGTAVFAADEATSAPEHSQKEHPKFHGLMPPKALKDLNLTHDQEAKYKQLDEEFGKARDQWMSEHKPKDNDPAAADSDKDGKPPKRAEGRKEMHELRHKYMDQFRATLTPEQTKQLDAQIADVKERREARHKHADENGDKHSDEESGNK